MCLDIGTPKLINFPFGANGKLTILGVPLLKHIVKRFHTDNNFIFRMKIQVFLSDLLLCRN